MTKDGSFKRIVRRHAGETGQRYTQAPFRYQVKCRDALRKSFAALALDARAKIEPVLKQTGCLAFLQ